MNASFIIILLTILLASSTYAYEKPWGSKGVTYDHTIVHTKHENVSSFHAVIGEFARRAIMNGGSARRRLAAGDFDELFH